MSNKLFIFQSKYLHVNQKKRTCKLNYLIGEKMQEFGINQSFQSIKISINQIDYSYFYQQFKISIKFITINSISDNARNTQINLYVAN